MKDGRTYISSNDWELIRLEVFAICVIEALVLAEGTALVFSLLNF